MAESFSPTNKAYYLEEMSKIARDCNTSNFPKPQPWFEASNSHPNNVENDNNLISDFQSKNKKG